MRSHKILLLDYPGNRGRHGRTDSTHGTAFWGSSSDGGLLQGILGTWTGGIGPWRGVGGKTGIRGHWVLIPDPRQGVDGRPCRRRDSSLGGCLLGGCLLGGRLLWGDLLGGHLLASPLVKTSL